MRYVCTYLSSQPMKANLYLWFVDVDYVVRSDSDEVAAILQHHTRFIARSRYSESRG